MVADHRGGRLPEEEKEMARMSLDDVTGREI